MCLLSVWEPERFRSPFLLCTRLWTAGIECSWLSFSNKYALVCHSPRLCQGKQLTFAITVSAHHAEVGLTAVAGQFMLLVGENMSHGQELNDIDQSQEDIRPGPDCNLLWTRFCREIIEDWIASPGSLRFLVGISRLAEKGPNSKRTYELLNAYSLRDYPQGRLMRMG